MSDAGHSSALAIDAWQLSTNIRVIVDTSARLWALLNTMGRKGNIEKEELEDAVDLAGYHGIHVSSPFLAGARPNPQLVSLATISPELPFASQATLPYRLMIPPCIIGHPCHQQDI